VVRDISDAALQMSHHRISIMWSATAIALHIVGKQTMMQIMAVKD